MLNFRKIKISEIEKAPTLITVKELIYILFQNLSMYTINKYVYLLHYVFSGLQSISGTLKVPIGLRQLYTVFVFVCFPYSNSPCTHSPFPIKSRVNLYKAVPTARVVELSR